MVDVTAVIVIIGFIGVIGTVAGLIFWMDRKFAAELRLIREDMREMREDMRGMQSEMREDMREMQSEMREDMREMRTEIRRLDRDIRVLGAKVDRAQGNLDVLVFGERGVPPSVEMERAELESRAEEAVGG